ncbi:MAG: AMP-binding protein, partial [Deltaproteobacteria bacterium]|nr:AMP-binding protein [Deltaproteobacteria bacterium]
MSNSMGMLSLLAPGRPLSQTVAWRNDGDAKFEQFLARVIAWRNLLIDNPRQSFALFIQDGFEFAGALFGAWQAEKTIYLPGDSLPATCAALGQTVDGFLGEFAADWSPLMATHNDPPAAARGFHRLEPEFVGLVLYTSGTTGAAQPIPKKLAQLSREVATLEQQFGGLARGAGILTTVSHQHIYGLLFQILWPLTEGHPFHSRTFSFFEELTPVLVERDCVLVSSPAHLKRLPENGAVTTTARPVRGVFSSGGALSFEVAQQARRVLRQVPIEVYGSSETGGVAWRQQHGSTDAKWRPFPGVAWRVDPQEGVLEIRSPNLPDDDWFRTADRALPIDDDGFLLKGRVDRIAKIEGKRISLNAL